MHRVLAIATMTVLAACGPKQRQVEDPAPWMTDKQSVRMDIVRTLLENDNSGRALQLIRLMRADGVDEPELDLLHGIAMRQQGMYEDAERLLLQVEAKRPRSAEVHRELCVLYADIERIDEAVTACLRATELAPEDAKAWNNYGYLLLTVKNEADTAKVALQKAVELDSTNARYRNNLAYAQAAAGDHRAALRTFMTTGTPADAHYNVGTAFERAGDPITALTYYERALKMDAHHLSADEAVRRLAAKNEEN